MAIRMNDDSNAGFNSGSVTRKNVEISPRPEIRDPSSSAGDRRGIPAVRAITSA